MWTQDRNPALHVHTVFVPRTDPGRPAPAGAAASLFAERAAGSISSRISESRRALRQWRPPTPCIARSHVVRVEIRVVRVRAVRSDPAEADARQSGPLNECDPCRPRCGFAWRALPRRRDPGTASEPRAGSRRGGGPKTDAPRARPVPESIVRYPRTSRTPASAIPPAKCCFTYARIPVAPCSSRSTAQPESSARLHDDRLQDSRSLIIVAQPIALSVAPGAVSARNPDGRRASRLVFLSGLRSPRSCCTPSSLGNLVDDVNSSSRACCRRGCGDAAVVFVSASRPGDDFCQSNVRLLNAMILPC